MRHQPGQELHVYSQEHRPFVENDAESHASFIVVSADDPSDVLVEVEDVVGTRLPTTVIERTPERDLCYSMQWSNEEVQERFLEDLVGMDDCAQLLGALGSLLLPIMEESIEPLSIMQHRNKLENYYRNLETLRCSNEIVAIIISNLAFQNPNMRILKIGWGSSTATTAILEALGSKFLSYRFTDVATKYLDDAKEACKAWGGKMKYAMFDTEKDSSGQGFDLGSYDLVFVSNIGLAARARASRRVPHLTESQWDNILETTGFSGIDASVHISPSDTNIASVILSTACSEQPPVCPKAAVLACGVNKQGLVQAVIDQVATVIDQPQITTGHLTNFGLDDQYGVVLALDMPLWSDLTEDDLKTMQRLIASARGFLWMTRCAKAANPAMNMLSGFARTVRSKTLGSDLSRLTWTSSRSVQKVIAPRRS
ncbi:MAG: hypothetical protein Q9204_002084 [Flavoplaca sp. TL-2023a]